MAFFLIFFICTRFEKDKVRALIITHTSPLKVGLLHCDATQTYFLSHLSFKQGRTCLSFWRAPGVITDFSVILSYTFHRNFAPTQLLRGSSRNDEDVQVEEDQVSAIYCLIVTMPTILRRVWFLLLITSLSTIS